MAPLRCAILGALALAADGSPIIALARRLSGPSEACLQACPGAEAFAAAMGAAGIGDHDGPTTTVADEEQTTAADEPEIVFSPTPAPDSFGTDGFVGTKALEALQGMCQHQDVISCLEDNSGVCDLAPEELQGMKSHLSCVCDHCPGMVEAQVGFAAVLVDSLAHGLSDGAVGSEPDQADMCKLASCMHCAAQHPAQCAFMDQQAGMLDRRLNSMMGQVQMPSCPQDATCSASAPESEPEAPESRSSSKAGEISPRSLVTSLLAVVVPLLVVAR